MNISVILSDRQTVNISVSLSDRKTVNITVSLAISYILTQSETLDNAEGRLRQKPANPVDHVTAVAGHMAC